MSEIVVPEELPGPGARPKTFRWTAGLIIGLVLAAGLIIIAIVAPLIWGEAASTLTDHANEPASAAHPLGTDSLGRDMLARSLVATQLTLMMSVGATVIAVGGGILLGAGLWLSPRRLREAGLRFVEIAVSYPALLISLLVAAILGAGTWSAVLAIGVANLPTFARLTANMAGSLTQREFVSTAKLMGVPPGRVLTRHLLPNMAEPLLVLSATTFSVALMEISGLSFVGLGVQSPQFDFGRLLVDALPAIYTSPIQIVGPVVMIIVTGLTAVLIGDGLAAGFNVRAAKRFMRPVLVDLTATEPPPEETVLTVDQLRVSGPDGRDIVRGVSFEVRRGEIVGIVGESGSGKSLTAMSVAQLLPDSLAVMANRMSLGEIDLRRKADPHTLATRLSIIYQDPGTTFNPALRMGRQLTEVLTRHGGLTPQGARDKMVEALEAVRVTEPRRRMQQHPHELSGGMRQRAMIAGALAIDPELIIADEPTTALDVTVQAEILRIIKRVNRERGTSVLIISHDLGVVEELCDRVLVMRQGEIVERLTATQLRDGAAEHPYTKALIAATPVLPPRELDDTETEISHV